MSQANEDWYTRDRRGRTLLTLAVACVLFGMASLVSGWVLSPEVIYEDSSKGHVNDFTFSTEEDEVLLVMVYTEEGGREVSFNYTIINMEDGKVLRNESIRLDDSRTTLYVTHFKDVRYKYEFLHLEGSGMYRVLFEGDEINYDGHFSVQLREIYVPQWVWMTVMAVTGGLLIATIALTVTSFRWKRHYEQFDRPFWVLLLADLVLLVSLVI